MLTERVFNFIKRWFFTNHKDIGTLYIIFGLFAGVIGTVLSIFYYNYLEIILFFYLFLFYVVLFVLYYNIKRKLLWKLKKYCLRFYYKNEAAIIFNVAFFSVCFGSIWSFWNFHDASQYSEVCFIQYERYADKLKRIDKYMSFVTKYLDIETPVFFHKGINPNLVLALRVFNIYDITGLTTGDYGAILLIALGSLSGYVYYFYKNETEMHPIFHVPLFRLICGIILFFSCVELLILGCSLVLFYTGVHLFFIVNFLVLLFFFYRLIIFLAEYENNLK